MNRIAAVERKVRYKTKLFVLDGLLRPDRPMDMVRLGSYFGGWWIPRIEPSNAAAICVGAGLDVSFDRELKRLGYRVFTVDPTPAAVEYVEREAPDLTLVPVGVWEKDGDIEFKQNGRYDDQWAISAARHPDVKATSPSLSFPVLSVKSLLDLVGEPKPAILKIDIEGAEHAVLRSLIRDRVRPACICVEFDDQRLRKIIVSHMRLKRSGYRLLQIENFNLVYVSRE